MSEYKGVLLILFYIHIPSRLYQSISVTKQLNNKDKEMRVYSHQRVLQLLPNSLENRKRVPASFCRSRSF